MSGAFSLSIFLLRTSLGALSHIAVSFEDFMESQASTFCCLLAMAGSKNDLMDSSLREVDGGESVLEQIFKGQL